LYQWHQDHGAKLGEFAGWEMPFQYGDGALAEHRLVRRSAGAFDISHMGQLSVEGIDSREFLDFLITSDIAGLEEGESRYGLLCTERGMVLDDVFTYRLPDRWFVVVNAANREKDRDWLRNRQEGLADRFPRVSIRDVSDETAMLAIQGPKALDVLDALTDGHASRIARFGAEYGEISGNAGIIGRTGYTGEDGAEVFVSVERALDVWNGAFAAAERMELDFGPVGLAARDSLRFEPGFPLYGHELDEETTPVEARLKWACFFERSFIGREAILEELDRGLRKRLVTLSMEQRGLPRQGYPVTDPESGEQIGEIATGMYAPTLDWYYANAFVAPEYAKRDTRCGVDIRGRIKHAVVTKRPLYKPSYK
jgi:glycine cleavage system T protein